MTACLKHRQKGEKVKSYFSGWIRKTKPLRSYCFMSHCDKGREFWKGECDFTKKIIILPVSLAWLTEDLPSRVWGLTPCKDGLLDRYLTSQGPITSEVLLSRSEENNFLPMDLDYFCNNTYSLNISFTIFFKSFSFLSLWHRAKPLAMVHKLE